MHLISGIFLICLVIVIPVIGTVTLIETESLNGPLTNMQVVNDTLYIGGKNKIYALDKGLNIVSSASTCDRTMPECENINKILLVNDSIKKLVSCGTGKNGICEVRRLSNLSYVETESKTDAKYEPYLVVSTDLSRPAVGMLLNDGSFMIAVTFGSGIVKVKEKYHKYPTGYIASYSYAISTRDVSALTDLDKTLKLEIVETNAYRLEDYIIYYKKGFQHNGYSYFITNQKKEVHDKSSMFESKLVRICQNDTAYRSYTDIVISCESGYNLVQDVVLISKRGKPYLIGIFTQKEDPEKPSGNSLICGGSLDTIDEEIIGAKKDYITNSCMDRNNTKRYLPNDDRRPICSSEHASIEDFLCDRALEAFTYVIGKRSYQMKKMNQALSFDGILTSLHGSLMNSRTVVLAGTSTGILYMMNLKDTDSLEMFDQRSVGTEPVKAIHQVDDDTLFMMTTNKVMKYITTDCTEFKTCHSVMERRNPLCGWCLFQNRATRNSSTLCPREEWLQSFGSCVKLQLDVRGVQAGNAEKTFVEFKVLNLPYRQNTRDTYSCRFSHGQREIGTPVATRDDSTGYFSCKIPTHVSVHTEAKLELIVHQNISLASTSFLFYKCDHFKRCGDCVNTIGANCRWNLQTPECTNIDAQGFVINTVEKCPRLVNNKGLNFIPRNNPAEIKLKASNLFELQKFQVKFWCYIPEEGITVDGTVDFANTILTCSVTINSEEIAKKELQVFIKYGSSKEVSREMDDEFANTVTLYDCSKLAEDCSQCKSLNTSRYKCSWCSNKKECGYGNVCDEKCPAPSITKIVPRDGPVQGNTLVTIYGTELGTEWSDINSVMIAQKRCNVLDHISNKSDCLIQNEDLNKPVPKCILCRTSKVDDALTGQVVVKVNESISQENITYEYKKVSVDSISPKHGPKAGGTEVTIHGKNLGIGNRIWRIFLQSQHCLEPKVVSDLDLETRAMFYIKCETPAYHVNTFPFNLSKIILVMDEQECYNVDLKDPFMILQNPEITGVRTSKQNKAFLSGGIILTVIGRRIWNGNVGKIILTYKGEQRIELCNTPSEEEMLCKVPEAPQGLRTDLMELSNQTTDRQKRATCNGCIEVNITVKIDGVETSFVIKYFRDPSFYKFRTDGEVLLYGSDKQQLALMGDDLNLVATKYDFNVTIGVAECVVIKLSKTELTCSPPNDQPAPIDFDNQFPEVNVKVGNIHVTVGYLEYEEKVDMTVVIGGAAAGAVLFILLIIFAITFVKYKKAGRKVKKYEQNLSNIEMEIRKVAREDCLDTLVIMPSVNKKLSDQVYPYHGYQQFACNVMFSVDFPWTEPVKLQALNVLTDNERMKANKAMESLESLIYNKLFFVSVISTMEKEKRFLIEEKCNLAGYLCSVLMGKMEYLNEILKMLMTNLVQDSSAKKHKTLFTRCDSITEKLLSNWMLLCLYPHLKSHLGSPLYLLYMATQKMIESGPIDAVTYDAKYTLSIQKLLKNWTSQDGASEDLRFDAKPLTLNVAVDDGEEIFKCKVLDCDTISQVKRKCLSQIYLNLPASQLHAKANDFALEWQEGLDGVLKLRDVDNSSKRDGHWIRLNTLAHYNVKDDSNVVLKDSKSAVTLKQEDNLDLAHINMDGLCDGSMTPFTGQKEKYPHRLKYWHLVKNEESSKQGKSDISDLYLNRLFRTKLSIMEYIRPLFDVILDKDRCPPPTKFLFGFLDYLGERYKVDSDTVHAWKSHSYAVRVWSNLMKMPNMVFDVAIPTYMNGDLDIISQVFIESFCLVPQTLTKDSPSQKLIFHHEMNHYRDSVKEFYIKLKIESQNEEEFNQYLTDVNRLQQETTFNKASVLYLIYKQLKPYFEDILKSLSTNIEASVLGLDRKLEQVVAIMEEGNSI